MLCTENGYYFDPDTQRKLWAELLVSDGGSLERLAARWLRAVLPQEPPRKTRRSPVLGP